MEVMSKTSPLSGLIMSITFMNFKWDSSCNPRDTGVRYLPPDEKKADLKIYSFNISITLTGVVFL